MEVPKEFEADENLCLGNQRTCDSSSDKIDNWKTFNSSRRQGGGVLAELETIPESNAVSDYSFHARGNASFNKYLNSSVKKKQDRLCQSFTLSSDININNESSFVTDMLLQPSSPSKFGSRRATPPRVLRERIKEAQEVRSYLEKQLDELKDFTTNEKQILEVEKGYESLQEENSNLKTELQCVQEQNSRLKIELDEKENLTKSQKELINTLKCNFDEQKEEIRNLKIEKENISKDLKNASRKLLEEEFKHGFSEEKSKRKEEELTKSLEEAWSSLRIKESRLITLNEKINSLNTERKLLNISGNSAYSEEIKKFDTFILELFTLSCSNIESENVPAYHCKGDSLENRSLVDIEVLNNDLRKCYDMLELNNKELNELNSKLEEKQSIIEDYEATLTTLEKSFAFHVNDSPGESKEYTNSICKEEHTTNLEKLACEYSNIKKVLMEKNNSNLLSGTSKESLLKEGVTSELTCDHDESSNRSLLDNSTSIMEEIKKYEHFEKSDAVRIDSHSTSVLVQENIDDENIEIIKRYKDRITALEKEIITYKQVSTMDQSKTSVLNTAEIFTSKPVPCLQNSGHVDIILQEFKVSSCMSNQNIVLDSTIETAEQLVTSREISSQTDITFEYLEKFMNCKGAEQTFVTNVVGETTLKGKLKEKTANSEAQIMVNSLNQSSQFSSSISEDSIENCSSHFTSVNMDESNLAKDKFKENESKSQADLTLTRKNEIFEEYIDLPLPDVSTLDYTFNCALEHSILKSKLHTSDSSIENLDPLASISEKTKENELFFENHKTWLIENNLKLFEKQCQCSNEEMLVLINKISDILSPKSVVNQDLVLQLKHLLSRIYETVCDFQNDQYFAELGLLAFFKQLCEKVSISDSFKQGLVNFITQLSLETKCIREDLLKLCSTVQQFKISICEVLNLISNNTEYLNDNLIAENLKNDELKQNFENLLTENRNIKIELSDLKLMNSDLKQVSLCYNELQVKNSELITLLNEKESNIKEFIDLKTSLQLFNNKIKGFNFMTQFIDDNDKIAQPELFSNCNYHNLFVQIENIFKELDNCKKCLENLNVPSDVNIFRCIEKICNDKSTQESYVTSKLLQVNEIHNRIPTIKKISADLKNNLHLIAIDVQNMKCCFEEDINKAKTVIKQVEKYSAVLQLHEKVQEELAKCKEDCLEHEQEQKTLKLTISQIECENNVLKEQITKFDSEFIQQSCTVEKLRNENSNLRTQLNDLESLLPIKEKYAELAQTYESLNSEYLASKETCKKYFELNESLKSTGIKLELENADLKEHVEKLKSSLTNYMQKVDLYKEPEDSSCNLQILLDKIEILASRDSNILSSFNQLKEDYSTVKQSYSELEKQYTTLKTKLSQADSDNHSLVDFNENYSKLLTSYKAMETELSTNKSICAEHLNMLGTFELKNRELESENDMLRKKVSNFEDDNYKVKVENQEFIKKFKSLQQSHDLLKKDQEKYFIICENLQILTNFVANFKDNSEILVSTILAEEFREVSKLLENIFLEFTDFKKKFKEFENEVKLSSQIQQEEIHELLKKEQESSELLKKKIAIYDNEINIVLSALDYTNECKEINEDSWYFIKQKIDTFKSKELTFDRDSILDNLERKVAHLESELIDADNFKRKFSRELHGLKPNLRVNDLMKLSLEDLQTTMLATIMEKENAIVANMERDFEAKLAICYDRIKQLEEESKRRTDWIIEIENENEKLLNECKQVQDDNTKLKQDLKSNIETIKLLEKKIEEQKANISNLMSSSGYEMEYKEEKNHSFSHNYDTQGIVDVLTRKLQENSKEFRDNCHLLQNKSEIIWNLEKVISETSLEKANLEEKITKLTEDLNRKEVKFSEIKENLEKDVTFYKSELCRLSNELNLKDENHLKDKLDLQKEIDSKMMLFIQEFKKLEKDTETVTMQNITRLLDTHLVKFDKLNTKIKELNNHLKFNDLDNERRLLIENLKAENNNLQTINNQLNEENDSLRKLQNSNTMVGELEEDTSLSLTRELTLLKDERAKLKHDLQELLLIKDQCSLLDDSLKRCQNELATTKAVKNNLMEENNSLSGLLHKCRDELSCALNQSSLKCADLTNELSLLRDKFNEVKKELIRLKTEKESLSQESQVYIKQVKDEIDLLNNKLISSQADILNLKNNEENDNIGLLSNLEFERNLNSSLKLELVKKENELLNMEKERDSLMLEYNNGKLQKDREIESLQTKLNEVISSKENHNRELESLNILLNEKINNIKELEMKLREISSTYHSVDSCPYKLEAAENKRLRDDYNTKLSRETDKFNQWKINFEEDLRCKVLLISDLESKLKKEVHNYREAQLSNKELQKKLIESDENIKKLEEKIAIQRDVFIKEQSKLNSQIQNLDLYKQKAANLDLYKEKAANLESKIRELIENINSFLGKASDMFGKTIIDFEIFYTELDRLKSSYEEEKQKVNQLGITCEEEKEKVKQLEIACAKETEKANQLETIYKVEQEKVKELDEECEMLCNENRSLQDSLGKLYSRESEKLNELHSKLKEEQAQRQNLVIELYGTQNTISALRAETIKLEQLSLEQAKEKQALEIKINNLLEEKEKLLSIHSEMEKKIVALQATNKCLENKDKEELNELKKELNFLKVQIVSKNTQITKLEMRLESDCLPFQKQAEASEKKVEELIKEIKYLKLMIHSQEPVLLNPTSRLSIEPDSSPGPSKEELLKNISSLQKEIQKLQKDKTNLKKVAYSRGREIKELIEQLDRRKSNSGGYK